METIIYDLNLTVGASPLVAYNPEKAIVGISGSTHYRYAAQFSLSINPFTIAVTSSLTLYPRGPENYGGKAINYANTYTVYGRTSFVKSEADIISDINNLTNMTINSVQFTTIPGNYNGITRDMSAIINEIMDSPGWFDTPIFLVIVPEPSADNELVYFGSNAPLGGSPHLDVEPVQTGTPAWVYGRTKQIITNDITLPVPLLTRITENASVTASLTQLIAEVATTAAHLRQIVTNTDATLAGLMQLIYAWSHDHKAETDWAEEANSETEWVATAKNTTVWKKGG